MSAPRPKERGSEETWEPGFRKMEALVKITGAHTHHPRQSRETPIGDWPAIAAAVSDPQALNKLPSPAAGGTRREEPIAFRLEV